MKDEVKTSYELLKKLYIYDLITNEKVLKNIINNPDLISYNCHVIESLFKDDDMPSYLLEKLEVIKNDFISNARDYLSKNRDDKKSTQINRLIIKLNNTYIPVATSKYDRKNEIMFFIYSQMKERDIKINRRNILDFSKKIDSIIASEILVLLNGVACGKLKANKDLIKEISSLIDPLYEISTSKGNNAYLDGPGKEMIENVYKRKKPNQN